MNAKTKNFSWLFERPIAHRGLHNQEFCENSLPAYKNAINNGYPIEMDVQMTKDGKLVCFHDDNLLRMTGKDQLIWELTYQQISQLNLKNTDQKIPLFSDFLKLVNGATPLLIEIKQQRYKGIEQKVINALKDYKGDFVVQSFDPFIMRRIRKLDGSIIRGQLGGCEKGTQPFIKYFVVKNLIFNCLSKPHFINYRLEDLPLKSKLPVICWTVRSQRQLDNALKYSKGCVFENFIPQ